MAAIEWLDIQQQERYKLFGSNAATAINKSAIHLSSKHAEADDMSGLFLS